ncbi:peptidylprolyl isomerase [Plasticicumulans sp.]|uniref:peptidylprolyl isomerase n=1 Tax=Plasticicumulans sp. TaxID=2307179 RepID=UPI002BC0E93D|nr:peptidylprolyl isomerase [Plasticicumulans sp.]MBS0600855.1 peptidylprolyl isomerase [Pseudomonadota bacterium]HNG51417.1 peptidylprolyl isomerase [Plasticicumulans sp.]HNO61998.1 peptidylprolyl isomerase [Plasticicumulans sp.]
MSETPVTVTVNGVEIAEADIQTELQHHPLPDPAQARQAAATALVMRELLLQEARSHGIDTADTDTAIATLIERAVQLPQADAATCRQVFDANPKAFRTPDLYEVAHILFAAAPGIPEDRAAAKSAAETTIADLVTDPSRFAALAAERSACPSKATGGQLGQIGPRQTVPEFEQALPKITPGTVGPEPVETRFGFHVIRVERRIDGRPLAFEQVQDKIAQYLADTVRHTAMRQYLQVLIGKAEISGIELEGAGAGSPLVQ